MIHQTSVFKTVRCEIDAEVLIDMVKGMIYKTFKEQGIAYPRLEVYVGEKGKSYKLTYRSENRPNGYEETTDG